MLNNLSRPGDLDPIATSLRRTGFHADLQPDSEAVVVTLHGELDMATCPALEQALGEALDSGRPVIVDMASLTFMDSTGISVLLGACRRAEEAGRSLVVRSPRRPVLKAFQLTGVDQILGIGPNEPLTS